MRILCLLWLIGGLISFPFLWMVEFKTDPDQCILNVNLFHLIYIISFNVLLIFIPTLGLTILYIIIIIKIKRHIGFYSNSYGSKKFGSVKIIRNHSKNSYYTSSSAKCINHNPKSREASTSMLNVRQRSLSVSEILTVQKNSAASETSALKSQNHICKTVAKNNTIGKLKFTIIISSITIVFFCFQLPVRIFLCWSYLNHYMAIFVWNDKLIDESNFYIVDVISHLTKIVYLLHCISNPIIYNVVSNKFRKSFIQFIKVV